MRACDDIATEVGARFRATLMRELGCGQRPSLAAALDGFPPELWENLAREFLDIMGAGEGEDGAGSALDPALRDRGQLIGPYRILEELGRGGQGVVWLAEDTRLSRRVALKVLSARARLGDHAALRFRREAEVASRLDHPGICTVYEAGIEDGTPYIAMQYIEGEDLGRRIASRSQRTCSEGSSSGGFDPESRTAETGPLDSDLPDREEVLSLVAIIEKTARALHAAHASGVVHRDIKPGNVLVTADGDPVITDFGLAREEDSDLPTLTRSGELFGTPAYMSPEQLTRQAIQLDHRSDVWSLGVTLYECLTLRRPFQGPTREALYQAILTREPLDPRRFNPAIPRDLQVVLETALQKDRDLRYQSARDLAEDLRRWRSKEPILARPMSPFGRALRWTRRNPFRAAAALLLLIVVAGAGFLAASWREIRAGRAAERAAFIEDDLEIGYRHLHLGPDPREARKSREALTRVLEMEAGHPEAIAGLAIADLYRDPQRAVSLLEDHAEALENHPELRALLAHGLRRVGRADEAENLAAGQTTPNSAQDWFLIGMNAWVIGDQGAPQAHQRALEAFTRAALMSPRPLYFYAWADVVGRTGDRDSAERVAEVMAHRWPKDSAAWYHAGNALELVDAHRAIEAYQRALKLDPAMRAAHFALGHDLAAHGEAKEAVAAYESALQLDPENPHTLVHLARVLDEVDRVEEARARLDEALRLDPGDAHVHAALGDHVMAKGSDPSAAIDHYRRALDTDPRLANCWFNLGHAYDRLDRGDDALEAFVRAEKLSPQDGEAAYRQGILHLGAQRFEAMAEANRRAVTANPEHHRAWYNLGLALDATRQHVASIEPFNRAIEGDPDWAEAHCNLGQALKKVGRYRDAVSALREGNRLAALRSDWTYDSQRWLDHAAWFLRYEERLEAVLHGAPLAMDDHDFETMTEVCYRQRRYSDAAQLWHLASRFATGGRLRAAGFAVRAASGEDARPLAEDMRALQRSRALKWLRAEFEDLSRAVEEGGVPARRAVRMLEQWQEEDAFAGVRVPELLSRLPEDEQPAWAEFWASVARRLEDLR